MRKVPTQQERVLQYIRDFGGITRAEAMSELGIANLPAVILDIRKKGVRVLTNEVESKNRYGQKITYAKYTLEETDNER
jgi:hypothetical protein